MTGTTISTYGTVGLSLTAASQSPVTITSTGTIATTAQYAIYAALGVPASIANDGRVATTGSAGVRLRWGGSVTNGGAADTTASIAGGSYGVYVSARLPGTVTNFATIAATGASFGIGVYLAGAGSVTNGSASDSTARISGYTSGVLIQGAGGTLTNFATIASSITATVFASAAYLIRGGEIANAGTAALISSTNNNAAAIFGAAGTVSNLGTILESGTTGNAVYLRFGGSVTNGSSAVTTSQIIGASRAVLMVDRGSVTNFGTIKGVSASAGRGVLLLGGGSVTNGSAADTAAYIGTAGRFGIYIGGVDASTVVNFGTIRSTQNTSGSSGVFMRAGGTVINGSEADTVATIAAIGRGIRMIGANPSSVVNFGTITGSLNRGVNLYSGGGITNGSATDHAALIQGVRGVYFAGAAPSTLTNFGTVIGISNSAGAFLSAGGTVVNGSIDATTASITGGYDGVRINNGTGIVTNYGSISGAVGVGFVNTGPSGVMLTGTGTVSNFGTIASTNGAAGIGVLFGIGDERLIDNPGAVFVGNVVGGSGTNTLELAKGAVTGTIAGLGTSFTNFGTVAVDSKAVWSLTGANSLASGEIVSIGKGGSLSVAGTLTAGAALTLTGPGTLATTGSGSIEIGAAGGAAAGALTVDKGSTLTATGTIAGKVVDAGTIATGGGTLVLTGAASGNGSMVIGAGDTLEADGKLTTAKVSFAAATGTLALGTPASVTATIAGFGKSDTIDLLGKLATTLNYVSTGSKSGTLTVSDAGGSIATLNFQGSYTTASFKLVTDGHGGTLITDPPIAALVASDWRADLLPGLATPAIWSPPPDRGSVPVDDSPSTGLDLLFHHQSEVS